MALLLDGTQFKKVGTYTWKDRNDQHHLMEGFFSKRSKELSGVGYIAGLLPGVVTVDGVPASRTIELHTREGRKEIFASTVSDPVNGTYMISDLNPNLLVDIVAREKADGVYNDIIISKIRPWTDYEMNIFGPGFPNMRITPTFKRTYEITGGTLPYQIRNDSLIPAEFIVSLNGRILTIEATAKPTTDFVLNVEDTSGLFVTKALLSEGPAIVSKFTGAWYVENDTQGEPRLHSQQITHNQSTSSFWTVDEPYSSLEFQMYTSSEASYDIFGLFINGTERKRVSGIGVTDTLITSVNVGDIVEVRYWKDGSQSSGTDEAYVYIREL